MIRRKFITDLSLYSLSGFVGTGLLKHHPRAFKDVIIGHNSHRYKVDLSWGALDSDLYPVNDCHEMVQDSRGRIILLTNDTTNNIIVYNKKGKLKEVWGTDYPGAHGLTLNIENGHDVLYISDNERHEVIKTTINGKVMQVFPCPMDSGKYEKAEQYIPTETVVASNGDLYVADGYGEQYILHYNAEGDLLNVFGGKGDKEENFGNAHGICIDTRSENATLLITDRMQNKLKRFTLDGKLLEVFHLPGAYICRPVIHGKHVFLATIWSGTGSAGTGFISILDEQNRLISAPGGNEPIYNGGSLQPMYQTQKIFTHPHDVCVDDEDNLYIAQWNAGKSYPIKLYRV